MASGDTLKVEQKRAERVVHLLREEYTRAECSLDFQAPHQLLVSTILSAQCTDKRVNLVTPPLFEKYSAVKDFAYADVNELAADIHSTGFHNQKARSIQGASLMIWEEYGGEVPETMDELIRLPGVGRKTANCVLGTAFGIPSMVIDTHMIRIMGLLGFTESKDPVKIEFEMMEIFPEKDWVDLTHLIIGHGRQVCISRRPQCAHCSLNELCPSSMV